MKRQSPVEQPPPALTHPSGSTRLVRGRLRVHACRRRSTHPSGSTRLVRSASLSSHAADRHHPPAPDVRRRVGRSSWARRCRSTLTHHGGGRLFIVRPGRVVVGRRSYPPNQRRRRLWLLRRISEIQAILSLWCGQKGTCV